MTATAHVSTGRQADRHLLRGGGPEMTTTERRPRGDVRRHAVGDDLWRMVAAASAVKEGKVGSFCCPVLPVPLESASVARCGPTALFWCNVRPQGRQLRRNRECFVIVGTCEYGPLRWSHSERKQRFSTHVDPGSAPSETVSRYTTIYGGAAGYCPRVRCVYFTPQFIAIAG